MRKLSTSGAVYLAPGYPVCLSHPSIKIVSDKLGKQLWIFVTSLSTRISGRLVSGWRRTQLLLKPRCSVCWLLAYVQIYIYTIVYTYVFKGIHSRIIFWWEYSLQRSNHSYLLHHSYFYSLFSKFYRFTISRTEVIKILNWFSWNLGMIKFEIDSDKSSCPLCSILKHV